MSKLPSFVDYLLKTVHENSISDVSGYARLNKSKEKLKEAVYVGEDYRPDNENIDDFIELLKSYKELGATHISFESEYDSYSPKMEAKYYTEETDEEYLLRMIKVAEFEKRKAAIADEREREEYGRLKIKYEKR